MTYDNVFTLMSFMNSSEVVSGIKTADAMPALAKNTSNRPGNLKLKHPQQIDKEVQYTFFLNSPCAKSRDGSLVRRVALDSRYLS